MNQSKCLHLNSTASVKMNLSTSISASEPLNTTIETVSLNCIEENNSSFQMISFDAANVLTFMVGRRNVSKKKRKIQNQIKQERR